MIESKHIEGLWYHGSKYNMHSGRVLGVIGDRDYWSKILVEVREMSLLEVPVHRLIIEEARFTDFRFYEKQGDWEADRQAVFAWWQER